MSTFKFMKNPVLETKTPCFSPISPEGFVISPSLNLCFSSWGGCRGGGIFLSAAAALGLASAVGFLRLWGQPSPGMDGTLLDETQIVTLQMKSSKTLVQYGKSSHLFIIIVCIYKYHICRYIHIYICITYSVCNYKYTIVACSKSITCRYHAISPEKLTDHGRIPSCILRWHHFAQLVSSILATKKVLN